MKNQNGKFFSLFCSLCIYFLLVSPLYAKPIGADAPICSPCCDQVLPDFPSGNGPCPNIGGGSFMSISSGNMGDTYPVVSAPGVNGSGLDFSLYYASYNADGEKATLNTVMGFGWSHSYNIFLFTQGRDVFKMSPGGLVTKYKRSGRRGPLVATRSHQQRVVENPDGSIDIVNNDGLTHHFEKITGNPIRVAGQQPWMLTKITDRIGNETVLTYYSSGPSQGLLEQVKDVYQRTIGFEYDSNNRISKINDPLNRETELTYDGSNNLASVKDPVGQILSYKYNSRHQLIRKTDKNSNVWQYEYDADGHPTAVRDDSGDLIYQLNNNEAWATDTYDLYRNKQRSYIPAVTSRKDGNGNTWQHHYDEDGFLTKLIAPDGATTQYKYDPLTRSVSEEIDANNHSTFYEYDAKANIIKKTDHLGHVTEYTYELLFNQMSSMTYPNGSVTEYEYDADGNRIKETRDVSGLNLVREWIYDGNGNVLTETDPNGHVTSYEYDIYGNLVKVTDPGAPTPNVTQYEYDILGNKTKSIDGNNHTTTYEYDDLDRLIKETDPLGFITEYVYDGNNNQIEVRRQVSKAPDTFQITNFEYDHRDRLVKETRDPAGLNLQTQTLYDANDNRISIIDPNGNASIFSYDVQNRMTFVVDALGNINETQYDANGNKTCNIDANGHHNFYEYDPLNRLVQETQKIGPQECTTGDTDDIITQYIYDTGAVMSCLRSGGSPQCAGPTPGSGNIAYSIDPKNKYTYFKYDKLDRHWITIREVGSPVDDCDGDDWCEYTEYDAADNVLARIDANGITAGFSYFDNNWPQSETIDPGGLNETTQYSYDAVGNVITVTTANGNVATNQYNDRNELIEVTDLAEGSNSKVASYNYDGIGNRISEQDGNNNGSSYVYDAVNRLIEVIDALGEDTDYNYDANGNLSQTVDREDHVICYEYDAINRRTHSIQKMNDTNCTVIDSDDLWTLTAYDAVGNVKQLITAKSGSVPANCSSLTPAADCEITDYEYDEINRLIVETYPDADSRLFTYDKASNLTRRTDQKGDVTLYEYNDLYYLTKRDYSIDSDDDFTYDTGGRMQTALRDGWLVTFTYDNANRVTATTQNGQSVTYSYDIPARKRAIIYPGGRIITESKDARERLERIDRGAGPVFPITPLAFYDYDLGNLVITRAYENGVQASYSYNNNNWITVLDHSVGVNQVAGFAYDYDKEGNKKYEERLHQNNRSEAYQYDDAYRLQEFKVGELVGSTVPMPTTQTQYDLDSVGNWDSKTTDGVVENRTHNTVNEITAIDGVSISHDDNGNLIEDESYEYTYDQENRLLYIIRKVDARLVGEYQYDALGRRVIKIESPDVTSSKIRFFYDDARLIEEQDASAVTQATYIYGNYIDEVLTMDRDGQVYYYHQNALWSIAAITDATATIVEQYVYDAYGEVTVTDGAGVAVPMNVWGAAHSAIGNSYFFTGRRLDEEAGLYYYRARYYDADKGRFLQTDPLGYFNGINLYEYVSSLPTHFLDPFGTYETALGFVCTWKTRWGGTRFESKQVTRQSTVWRNNPAITVSYMFQFTIAYAKGETVALKAFATAKTGYGGFGAKIESGIEVSASVWRQRTASDTYIVRDAVTYTIVSGTETQRIRVQYRPFYYQCCKCVCKDKSVTILKAPVCDARRDIPENYSVDFVWRVRPGINVGERRCADDELGRTILATFINSRFENRKVTKFKLKGYQEEYSSLLQAHRATQPLVKQLLRRTF